MTNRLDELFAKLERGEDPSPKHVPQPGGPLDGMSREADVESIITDEMREVLGANAAGVISHVVTLGALYYQRMAACIKQESVGELDIPAEFQTAVRSLVVSAYLNGWVSCQSAETEWVPYDEFPKLLASVKPEDRESFLDSSWVVSGVRDDGMEFMISAEYDESAGTLLPVDGVSTTNGGEIKYFRHVSFPRKLGE